MTITESHISVLIVGAGPSGLMMAAQLLRNGVQPLIIDSKKGPASESKALAVQARSLEIYRQMGIVDPVIANGKKSGGISFNEGGREKARLAFDDTGKEETLFPFILMYQQGKNERLLLDYLTHNCCPVYWGTTLDSLDQNAEKATVTLLNNGSLTTAECDWVIGADGAHSTVRQQLNIDFTGDTYQHDFYLADVKLNNPELEDSLVHLFMEKQGFAGFFPMPEENRYRIVGSLPADFIEARTVKLEDLLPPLNNIVHGAVNVTENVWFTTYRLHHRMAAKFREQHCFLIGDAAHIHSPVGGQGMNTGLQDAYNLAWKIAGVVNGKIKPAILNTYAAERMPVARRLLNTTDRVFSLIMSKSRFVGFLKIAVLPGLLKMVWKSSFLREQFFRQVSQIAISYRNSGISLHISQSNSVKAGDRLPYLKVYDEKKQEETDLHAWCSKPGFTLIVLGKLTEPDLFSIAKWITQAYAPLLNFFYLPPSAKNQHVFDKFEIKEKRAKSLIIRPDMHIGFINDAVDMVLMDNYLKNVIGIN